MQGELPTVLVALLWCSAKTTDACGHMSCGRPLSKSMLRTDSSKVLCSRSALAWVTLRLGSGSSMAMSRFSHMASNSLVNSEPLSGLTFLSSTSGG